MLRKKTKKYICDGCTYVALVLFLSISLFPILWMLLTSFKSEGEQFVWPPTWIPRTFSLLSNYVYAFTHQGGIGLLHSTIVATLAVLIALLVGTLSAYSLAKFNIKRKDDVAFWILSTRMLPPIAIIIPFFLLLRVVKLIDTFQGLILIYLTFNIPYVVWIMRGFFEEISKEIEEAALLDGCSYFQVFWRITLPLTRSGIVATAIFCFIFTWNEFLFAVILTRSVVRPVTVVIPQLVGSQDVLWGEQAALGIMSMVPPLILIALVQRHLIRGFTFGAVKE